MGYDLNMFQNSTRAYHAIATAEICGQPEKTGNFATSVAGGVEDQRSAFCFAEIPRQLVLAFGCIHHRIGNGDNGIGRLFLLG